MPGFKVGDKVEADVGMWTEACDPNLGLGNLGWVGIGVVGVGVGVAPIGIGRFSV